MFQLKEYRALQLEEREREREKPYCRQYRNKLNRSSSNYCYSIFAFFFIIGLTFHFRIGAQCNGSVYPYAYGGFCDTYTTLPIQASCLTNKKTPCCLTTLFYGDTIQTCIGPPTKCTLSEVVLNTSFQPTSATFTPTNVQPQNDAIVNSEGVFVGGLEWSPSSGALYGTPSTIDIYYFYINLYCNSCQASNQLVALQECLLIINPVPVVITSTSQEVVSLNESVRAKASNKQYNNVIHFKDNKNKSKKSDPIVYRIYLGPDRTNFVRKIKKKNKTKFTFIDYNSSPDKDQIYYIYTDVNLKQEDKRLSSVPAVVLVKARNNRDLHHSH